MSQGSSSWEWPAASSLQRKAFLTSIPAVLRQARNSEQALSDQQDFRKVIWHHKRIFEVLEKTIAEIILKFNYTLETASKMQPNINKLSQGL